MSDAALLAPDWRESFRHANGIDFHLVEAGRPGDPLLVLLHGFPEFWWAWREQIAPLAQAGYHVVAPDLRGFNRTSAPRDAAAYDLDILAADVVAIADALGAKRFGIVGHDWGAVVGWWLAARHPGRLSHAALIGGPHPQAWAEKVLRHPLQALRSAYIALFQLPWLPETLLGACDFALLRGAIRRSAHPGSASPAVLHRYAQAWAHPGSLTPMLNYYRALRGRKRGPSLRIRPSTLVLWGDRDRFLGREVMQAGLDLCEQGRFVVIEGGTHWLHWETPERVTAEILAFLSEG